MTSREEVHTTTHLASCERCRGEFVRLQRGSACSTRARCQPPSRRRRSSGRCGRGSSQPCGRSGPWTSWLLMSPAPLALAGAVVVLVVGAFFAGRAVAGRSIWTTAGNTSCRGGNGGPDSRGDSARGSGRASRSIADGPRGAAEQRGRRPDRQVQRTRRARRAAGGRYAVTAKAAKDAGDAVITDLPDEIERILTEVATTPNTVSARELADVRRRIESQDLLSKVRAASSEVRER